MPSQLTPYLNFNGNAREAMDFYHRVLGGDLTVNTFGDFGAPDPSIAGQVMHAQLTSADGYVLMASDLPPGQEHRPGNTMTVSISGDDPRLRDHFAALAEGGEVTVALEKQMWGDEFGALTDRFGTQWMVNLTTPQG